jgi:hypothetical protein
MPAEKPFISGYDVVTLVSCPANVLLAILLQRTRDVC